MDASRGSHMQRWIFFIFVSALILGCLLISQELRWSLLLGLVIALVLDPIITFLERKKTVKKLLYTIHDPSQHSEFLFRQRLTLIVYFVFIFIGLFFIIAIAPRIYTEISQAFSTQQNPFLFQWMGSIQDKLLHWLNKLENLSPQMKDLQLTDKVMSYLTLLSSQLFLSAPGTLNQIFIILLLTPIFGFVFVTRFKTYLQTYIKLLPQPLQKSALQVVPTILQQMEHYVAGKFMEAAFIGAFVSLGLLALGVPFAWLLGLIASLTNPIPYLGPILGFLPALPLLFGNQNYADHQIAIILVYGIGNMIDLFIIFPILMGRIVNLPALVVFLSVVLGSKLFGVIGMLLAVPIVSIGNIIVSMLYKHIYEKQ